MHAGAPGLPILIVGMPRSGTTLVEQVLASHPLVAGGGELLELGRIVGGLPAALQSSLPYPECVAHLDAQAAEGVRDAYLCRLRSVSPTAARVTDKMPTNYLHLGLVALVLPYARVIHCRRDPMDVCLSCYFQDFTSRLPYTYDLADLAFCYRQYERLMAHWRAVLPLEILDVPYEELVGDQEAVTRRMLEFCGLDWDARCLAFHENKRPVQTASSWQVRQPLYTTSIGRWKNYAEYLGPLRRALEAEGV